MDQEYQLDVGVAVECRRDFLGNDRCAVAGIDPAVGALDVLEDLDRPLAIIAVDENQRLAPAAGGEAAERRLDGKGARALHQHAFAVRSGMGEPQEIAADGADDLAELGIARTPVGKHRKLDRARRGEGAGVRR